MVTDPESNAWADEVVTSVETYVTNSDDDGVVPAGSILTLVFRLPSGVAVCQDGQGRYVCVPPTKYQMRWESQ